MVLFLLVLNFLLAIIVEAYMKVRKSIEQLNTEGEFFHDIWGAITGFFVISARKPNEHACMCNRVWCKACLQVCVYACACVCAFIVCVCARMLLALCVDLTHVCVSAAAQGITCRWPNAAKLGHGLNCIMCLGHSRVFPCLCSLTRTFSAELQGWEAVSSVGFMELRSTGMAFPLPCLYFRSAHTQNPKKIASQQF